MRVWALSLAHAVVACSGDSDSDGSAGAGNDYKATPHTTCPETSTPGDPDALFARHAGTYGFVPGIDQCGMEGARVTIDERYATTIRPQPKEIVVATDAGEWTFTWDGTHDLACESEFTSLVEVGSEAGFARATFIGDNPSIFLFGLCIGDFVR